MATWSGTTPYASKKQLVSSITGLYTDLQDLSGFQFQNLEVSTILVKDWISTPVLYVSDIQGANIDISGITFSKDGILNAPIISLSSLSFKGLDKLFDLDVSFDLGLGDALGGLLGGLGALVGGATIAVGTGAGLAIQGAEQGIGAMVAGRPQNYINENRYETLNFTTQFQVSTIGDAYPLYSTILRSVDSVSANQVPGKEIFVSTFFTPGTTCIRAVSDPFNLITGNSNLNTSTIQSFGEWTALPFDDNTTSLTLSNTTDQPLFNLNRTTLSVNNLPMVDGFQTHNFTNFYNFPYNTTPYPYTNDTSKMFYNRDEFLLNSTYISTNYVRFQSTFTDYNLQYIRSTLSAPLELTYTGNIFDGDFVFCEPDETGFRSTMVVDLIANGSKDLFLQWGLAVDNLNSTIAAGTSKRVSWDILAGYSNFIDIPQAQSTITNEATQQILDIQTNPHELKFLTLGTGMNPSVVAWDVNGMTFGSNTSLNNYQNYPYQFNSSVYVNGTLECQNLIALSTIFATSTIVESQLSTNSVIADYILTPELYAQEGFISTLKSTSNNWANDYISIKSRVRMMGYATPLSLITGRFGDVYDTTKRFDFTTDTDPQAIYLQSQPANNTLMTILSTNINIPNLVVENLTANNIVYSNADVPYLQTSTIAFGWTGNFASPTIPPQYALSQTLTTEPGLYWNNYQAASNQVLNIMSFSNNVNMIAQQFSTPLTYLNTTFDGTNRQGWASTIFTNLQTTTCRVNLGANAGNGELSLQGGSNAIAVSMNTNPGGLGGAPVAVPIGSTYKFSSDGTTWTTLSNAPVPGYVSYNNQMKMTMDFETFNISTTDTLVLSAEKINLNGIVNIPNANLSNLYTDGFVSTNQLVVNATPTTGAGINAYASYTGSYNTKPTANVFAYSNIINSTDFLTQYNTILPNRGFNMFNSYNTGEWNNAVYAVDITASSGSPIMILGDIIQTSPPFTPYSGQFWINNTIDSPAQPVNLYVNREGLLSTIGVAPGNQYTRVYTNDGTNWNFQSNVANPQGSTPASYSNIYSLQMTSDYSLFQNTKPVYERMPFKNIQTNKIMMNCPQIRVATYDSPSFVSREAGFEYGSYFDANVVFGEGGSSPTESDALNPIVNNAGNLYYSVVAWSPQSWFSRIRTKTLGIQGFDIDPIPILVSLTTPGDYIWASARYLNVEGAAPEADIRENYFMTPKNYHTDYGWLGQL